jgi:hypothetical protein
MYSLLFPALVSSLTLRLLIYFELIFAQGERHGSKFQFSTGRNPVFSATFIGETIISSSYVLDTFAKNQIGIARWIHIWIFCSVLLVFMSLFMPVPCYFIAMV